MLKENLKENLSVLAIRYLGGFEMLFELLFLEVEPPAHTIDCGCGLSIWISITYFMLMMSYDSQFQQVSERNLHYVIKMRLVPAPQCSIYNQHTSGRQDK